MSLKHRVLLIGALIAASLLGAAALEIWIDHRHTKLRNEVTASDVTRVVEKHILDTVTQIDGLLGEVAKTIIRDGGTVQMVERMRWEQLGSYCRSIIGCKVIAVIDSQGKSVAISSVSGATSIDVSDRDYFRTPKQTGKLFIDAAIVTRLPGRPILFNISKPVYSANGVFLGVISVGMNTEHFTAFYRLMGFSSNPTVTVFKRNGSIVARNPDMQAHVGKNNAGGPLFREHLSKAPSGVYESLSVLDGRTRVAAYRTIDQLDLVVFTGIEKQVAFADWRERTLITLTIILVVLALTLGMLFGGYRSLLYQLKLRTRNRELDQLSNVDGLTGIANRRCFDDTAQAFWERHKEHGTPLSVLMIDIDHFKKYNDAFGHLAGDECLRKVAGSLQSCLHRKGDLAARFGGEEFAVILQSDEQGALVVADRIRREIEALAIAHGAHEARRIITVSIGLAGAAGGLANRFEELLGHADKALYEAKSRGRNRVSAKVSPAPQRATA